MILLNGILALAEIAIVSSRKARLQSLAESGDKKAQTALNLADNPSNFLSTVQIGITLVGVLTGAVSGATLGEEFGELLQQISWIAPYGKPLGITITVLIVTYLSLVLGELVPKRVALMDSERYARMMAPPMRLLSRLTSPLVNLLSASTDAVLGLLSIHQPEESIVTEEEIKVLISQGTQAGLFASVEQDMLEGVFRLADRRIGTLLTPRTEIVWLNLDDSDAENWKKVIESGYALFPVARGSLDEVIGVVHVKQILEASLNNNQIELVKLIDEPIWVPENLPALRVLELFEESRQHIALVIDEYGGLEGLVTINDILKGIISEKLIRHQPGDMEIVQREDGSWLLDGLVSIDDLKELLGIAQFPDEETARYQTLGGLIMTSLGHIPTPSENFDWKSYRFEVVDMDGLRVDKVLVSPLQSEPENNV